MTSTLEAELHRQLVLKGFSKTVQGHVMGCFRDAQKIVETEKPQPPMFRLVSVTTNYTNDLTAMLSRLIVRIRKDKAADSATRGLAELAYILLHDRNLLGSPLRDIPDTPPEPAPLDMVLHCPKCHTQHIDKPNSWTDEDAPCDPPNSEMAPEDWAETDRILKAYEAKWTNPPHKTHQCQNKTCNHEWRPANVPTNGVHDIAPQECSTLSART